MITESIVNAIYKYYPQNLDFYDIKAITDSQEYQNRIKKCHDAAANNSAWINFKNELTNYNTSKNGSRLYDYSMLGSVPCYHGSMKTDISKLNFISVFISVMVPLWAYKVIDLGKSSVRYKYVTKEEETVIINLRSLVSKHFPTHDFIDQDHHQIEITNIATAFKPSPTIFEAIFTENDN